MLKVKNKSTRKTLMIVHYMLGIETILETATLKICGNFENTFGKIDCSELYFKLENDKNSDFK